MPLGENGGFLGYMENVSAFEVSHLSDAEEPAEKVAFFSFAVGVLSRVETAFRVSHFSQHVIQGLFGDAAVQLSLGELVSMEVEAGPPRLVVEHLFKVGHQP